MSRKRRIAAGVVIALTTVLVGTAFALADISFVTGTTASYDFGSFGPGYPVPGTVQIQAFTVAPGETFPWHFHKATSYVVLVRGTLTEQQALSPGQQIMISLAVRFGTTRLIDNLVLAVPA